MKLRITPSVRSTVPRIEELFGTWAIRDQEMNGLLRYLETTGVDAHVKAARADSKPQADLPFYIPDGTDIAILPINGVITKSGSSLSGFPGTTRASATIRSLARASDVGSIVLLVDSPGGTVRGVDDFSLAIAKAAESKPVIAFIDDLGASAAYYLAASATTIVANPSAIVGSIGVFASIVDSSEAALKEGVRVHVIKTAEHKGLGVDGAAITNSQLDEVYRVVLRQHEMFLEAIEKGRGVSRAMVESWATGQVWIGDAARRMGLVDRIGSFDTALRLASELKSQGLYASRSLGGPAEESNNVPFAGTSHNKEEGDVMPGTDVERATLVALKRSLPNADAAFREECVIQGRTISESKDAWIAKLENSGGACVDVPGIDVDKLPAALGGTCGAGPGDAESQWKRIVEANKAKGMSNSDAVRRAAREFPEVREQYVAEQNANR